MIYLIAHFRWRGPAKLAAKVSYCFHWVCTKYTSLAFQNHRGAFEGQLVRSGSSVAITLVPVVLPGRARRVNVTLDEALLEEIDQISDNRSGFLAEATRAELARRRA